MSHSIQTAITISLVPQAQGGPFVFWHDLDEGIRQAAELGFDAIELFAPGPDAVAPISSDRNSTATPSSWPLSAPERAGWFTS